MIDIPAFPSHGSMGEVAFQGMTLRDYFAAAAMQGMFAIRADSYEFAYVAKTAYRIADAMLIEREVQP